MKLIPKYSSHIQAGKIYRMPPTSIVVGAEPPDSRVRGMIDSCSFEIVWIKVSWRKQYVNYHDSINVRSFQNSGNRRFCGRNMISLRNKSNQVSQMSWRMCFQVLDEALQNNF